MHMCSVIFSKVHDDDRIVSSVNGVGKSGYPRGEE